MRRILAWFRQLKWQRVAAQAGLFAALFLTFLYLTFPYDVVRDAIVQGVESRGRLQVEIADVRPFRLTGVQIEGLKISNNEDKSQVYVHLDKTRARVRLSQLLRGRVWVDFDAYAYGGGLAGSFAWKKSAVDMAVNFVDIKLSEYGTREIVRRFGQLDVDGVLGGSFDLHFDRQQQAANSGAVDMSLDKLRILNINMLGRTLPDMTFEPGHLALRLQRRNFQVQTFDLKGNNLSLQATGGLNLNEATLKKSRVNLDVKFKPSEEFESALGILAYGLGEPDDDGYYEFRISGPLDNIKTQR